MIGCHEGIPPYSRFNRRMQAYWCSQPWQAQGWHGQSLLRAGASHPRDTAHV